MSQNDSLGGRWTAAGERPMVLVAEDSAVHRIAMVAMLERAGFDVVAVDDGAAAIEHIEHRRPDVIVIDAMMPLLSGFETIAALQSTDLHATIPTIVVSGLEDVQSRLDAFAVGANDFLSKPVNPDELVARVRAQLRVTDAWQARVVESFGSRAAIEDERNDWITNVIRNRAFDTHFQPIVDMRNGRVRAQEALARFHDGTPPANIFETASALELLVDLELALVQTALTNARGLPVGVAVHVNISPCAALDPTLPEIISRTKRQVVLEITENALFSSDHAMTLRDSLPDNCSLAADDVGAGYAGLSQLLDFRPEIIKIDRAVVTFIDQDPARRALVAGLVHFSTATGSTVIAEGIERREEAEALLELGVHYGQGFHFSRPVPLFEASGTVRCVPAARHTI